MPTYTTTDFQLSNLNLKALAFNLGLKGGIHPAPYAKGRVQRRAGKRNRMGKPLALNPYPLTLGPPSGVGDATERLKDAVARWEAAGGPIAEKRVTNVLVGLGFRAAQFHRPCTEFSGGWQMRIAVRVWVGGRGVEGLG